MDETAAPASAPAAAPATAAAPRTIGERLRAGRERAGLSVAATAEKLHLDPKVIEALEADRFAELGASVYVRGHLRRYADFVGEAGAELVDIYTAREARPPPPDLTQIPQAERRTDPRRLVTPFVGLGGALVVALAIYWVLGTSRSGADRSATPPSAQKAPAPLPAPAEIIAPALAPPTAAQPAPLAVAPAPAASDASAAAPTREAPAAARTTRLRLELGSDSWVEIYDARGERLFYDVASAGSVQSVEGPPPLRVTLGSAVGVSVDVDGRRREIPATAMDGEGARFIVNRSGSLSRAR
jgi:cytoskeleton protein RodZ